MLANATCKSPATQPKNPQTILWIPTQRLIWVCRHRSSVILRTDSSSNKNPPLPWWRAPTRSPHKSENTKNQHGSFHCVLADPPSWYSPYPEQPHSVTFHSYVTILSHIWFVQPSSVPQIRQASAASCSLLGLGTLLPHTAQNMTWCCPKLLWTTCFRTCCGPPNKSKVRNSDWCRTCINRVECGILRIQMPEVGDSSSSCLK